MNRKFYLFAGLGLITLGANAQRLMPNTIEWPQSSQLHTYVQNWVPGTPLFEDENFFISRVKPKATIDRNTATQVYETITDANDKKLLFWVPVGNTNLNGVHTDALPNGIFDSEVFSSWSYVTHYGDWTAPYGWVPGGFADAAHKHGVAVSGVASIPNAALSGDWQTCMIGMGAIDTDKLAKFLLYHGVDGLSYNSEFSTTSSVINNLNNTHAAVVKKMKDVNPVFENIWYSGTGDNGQISFGGTSDCLRNSLKNIFGDSENVRTSIFANYEWNMSSSNVQTTANNAASLGRDMHDVYAGMNMQGGCKTTTEWEAHKTQNYSIGLWGAHDFNYLWSPRAQNGSLPATKQKTYQTLQEQWFTNGKRNPIAKMDILHVKSLGPNKNWHGMSPFMSERSTLGWSLDDEPFITYFNLGNGMFFNWKGERQHNSEWYNIGIQDYMPTWRFWFADKFLGKEPSNIPANGLDAEFVWDDAYMGGSCLRVYGSVADEYLHLFRTKFQLAKDDIITVRYKLISGSADVTLALSVDGAETKILNESKFVVIKNTEIPNDEAWQTISVKLTSAIANAFRANPVAMIALHFKNAENLDIRLGEFSITRGTTQTPAAPKITKAMALSSNYGGVDAKIIFNMANNRAAGDPVYNLDVNTSMFRLWAQEEGGEPVNMGATSSWAGMMFAIPCKPSTEKMRFGVQAVAVDFNSASEISWSDYMTLPEYAISNDIEINKSTVKPGEEFEIAFVDPKHPAVDWKLIDVQGNVKASGNGTSLKTSLNDVGAYHLEAGDQRYEYYMMVTAWSTGALPEITSLSVKKNNVDNDDATITITTEDELTLGYTGRNADGESSQAVEIDNKFIGFTAKEAAIGTRESFAVGAWIKFTTLPAESRVFSAEDRNGGWPVNNWGWVWANIDDKGFFDVVFRTSSENQSSEIKYRYFYQEPQDPSKPESDTNPKVKRGNNIPLNAWTHVAFSFEYEGNNFRLRTFLNGQEIMPREIFDTQNKASWRLTVGVESPDRFWVPNSYTLDQNNWLYFCGGAGSEAKFNDGMFDDLVLWNGAITAEDAAKAYHGLDADNLPENVKCYWSFEESANDANKFLSKGSLPGVSAGVISLNAEDSEGQGKQVIVEPKYNSGCPLIPGTAYKVVTTPSWEVKRAVVSESNGNAEAGDTKVMISRAGEYHAYVTLANSLGQDKREYPLITCAEVSMDNVDVNDICAYTIDDAIVVMFPEAGVYTVNVYNVAGQLVGARTVGVAAGEIATVGVKDAGVYLLNIVSDGNVVSKAKLIKK